MHKRTAVHALVCLNDFSFGGSGFGINGVQPGFHLPFAPLLDCEATFYEVLIAGFVEVNRPAYRGGASV